ncbi:MAG: response regulator transcription factor [Pseudomonadota bacterium]
MRLLLVEDDGALRATLFQALRLAGHGVDAVADGRTADAALATGTYDLVVLDLGLPHLDGLDVLQRLRERQDRTPVLVLTARDNIDERVRGLRRGADDYLTKPFALPELEARIEALLRRAAGGLVVLSQGPLEFDSVGRAATWQGRPLDLSVRETAILEALMQRAGQVVIKTRLAQQLSDWDGEVGANTIEVYVHRLRKKLDPLGIRIRTIHGLGYLLEQHAEH